MNEHLAPIFAIDPGTTHSGWVHYCPQSRRVIECGVDENAEILDRMAILSCIRAPTIAIEMIASYGMAVGREVFETCVWIGRFVQAAQIPSDVIRIERREIKLALCNSARAKDPNVRQALLDRFGGKAAVGTKKEPGPLYGVRSHIWPALAVAVVVSDRGTT